LSLLSYESLSSNDLSLLSHLSLLGYLSPLSCHLSPLSKYCYFSLLNPDRIRVCSSGLVTLNCHLSSLSILLLLESVDVEQPLESPWPRQPVEPVEM
jgi:hypothetical protein